MTLNASFSKEFLKPEHQGDNLSKGVPRSHLVEGFDKILNVIQRYFTCKGRFNMICQYHIRILLHFIGKDLMNIPLYFLGVWGKWMRGSKPSPRLWTQVFSTQG
jgi:hypothetical protein